MCCDGNGRFLYTMPNLKLKEVKTMTTITWIRKMVRMHSTAGHLIVREIRRFSFEMFGELVREILRFWIPLFAI